MIELKRNPKGKKLYFEILGNPNSKQSMRASVAVKNGEAVKTKTKSGKNKFSIHTFQNKKVKNDEGYIKWCIAGQMPFGHNLFTGPILITKLHYIFYPTKKILKKLTKEGFETGVVIYKHTTPDIGDNLNKMLFDAMQGIVYKNDAQIIGIDDLRKYYGLQPKTILTLEEL